MKGKNLAILIIATALLLTSCIYVYALTNSGNDSEKVYYASSGNESVDVESLKDRPVLNPDLKSAEYLCGETELSIPWGDTDDTFAKYENEDLSMTEGPQSFTVGDNGTIYVYDTFNHMLKSFKDGKLVGSLDLYDINGMGEYVGICSMAYLNGSIYALELNSDTVFKITGDEIVESDSFGELGNVEQILSTPCENLIIRDNYWQDGSIRVRSFQENGNELCEKKMGFYVSDSAYNYNDGEGNTIRMIDNGFKSYVFVIENPVGELIDDVNFKSFEEMPEVSNEGNGFDTSMSLIGTDNQGRIYMELAKTYYEGFEAYETDIYLIRLDIVNKTVDTIQIPVEGEEDNAKMPMTTGMMNSTLVTSDGSVYKAYMTVSGGTQIIRFDFD